MTAAPAVRVAAVGDVHLGADSGGQLRLALRELPDHADVLLLAGDLTRTGAIEEARVAAQEFGAVEVPVIAVLGNHEYHRDAPARIADLLTAYGITVLEGTGTQFRVGEHTVGVAGTIGFGGGFRDRCASAFGERVMREFAGRAIDLAESLDEALAALDTDVKIALTHYSPAEETLAGEPREIYPFLGSYLLGAAIDANEVDLAVHGHAHAGREHGSTPGGVPVRNVAQPVTGAAYTVYAVPARDRDRVLDVSG
ncbi:metallophosphoesterase family protein [Nocardia stercoris]|uniref:Metallophosphoesterase n=1 Tax=Nocardia stercoris TaxID=2483361 RepID=A0A3M2L472_9NOCA|nr:metallophosphoesterase [Nocardia stercoris]RMI31303.1 metallophosphoesterase [Nocardia stercoris]